MQTINIIELKGMENTPSALTKGMVLPYVRENYINKFKDRLADDLFAPFIENTSHRTGIALSGGNSEVLIIETDMFKSEAEVFSAITKALNHNKICTLFSIMYTLDIESLSICLRNNELQACVFLLCPPTAIRSLHDRSSSLGIKLNVLK